MTNENSQPESDDSKRPLNEPRGDEDPNKPEPVKGDDPADSDHSTILPELEETHTAESFENSQNEDTDPAIDETVSLHSESDEADELQTTLEVDPTAKTVDEKQGVRVSQNRNPLPKPIGETTEIDTTADGHRTSHETPSMLESANIGETINPREMSEKDAAFWGSLSMSRDSKQDPSVLPPAIDRSLTETKLQIRGRRVATPKSDPAEPSDYRLVRLLGKGGMGNVYVARQGSLDRLLAVKVIKPLSDKKREKLRQGGKLDAVEQERRQQFLSEAVVTGDLDHPNIVPIHDIAVTADNTLFYSMKRVVGTPWSKVINDKSVDENLEILLKASDAVGFAHTRGVVHRDIKPENIMLGDFGVVMVMDWGLAVATKEFEKIESIYPATGLGGSPAFMAPEMVVGPVSRIGPASDIYLLGATLYSIITGHAPHSAPNVSQCLKAVAANEIRPVAPENEGELLDIALKAMATRPEDRYDDVASFQSAIRQYRAHAQSIDLCNAAQDQLAQGRSGQDYEEFARASHGFEQAIRLWDGNDEARTGLEQTRTAYAQTALDKGDYELGLSLLDESNTNHLELIGDLRSSIRQRDRRKKLVRGLVAASAAMLAVILVGGSYATYRIEKSRQEEARLRGEAENATAQTKQALDERTRALDEKQLALQAEERARQETVKALNDAKVAEREARRAETEERLAKEKAQTAQQVAVEARKQEEKARMRADNLYDVAEKRRQQAEASQEVAIRARNAAQYERVVSMIGLAKARIEQREFSDARKILTDIRAQVEADGQRVGWEWKWLWTQASQAESVQNLPNQPVDLSMSQVLRRAVVTLDDGQVFITQVSPSGELQKVTPIELPSPATCATISDRGHVAIGTSAGEIILLDESLQQPKRWFVDEDKASGVNDLQFVAGYIVSASNDHAMRLWTQDGDALAVGWHIAPVQRVNAATSSDSNSRSIVVAAVAADESTGKVVVWNLNPKGAQFEAERVGDFVGHHAPVTAVALAPDLSVAASGDTSGNILVWNPRRVLPIDYQRAIEDSVAGVSGETTRPRSDDENDAEVAVLRDEASNRRFVSANSNFTTMATAHEDVITSLQLAADGTLLSSSQDYTLKLWDSRSASLKMTFQGHGGPISAASIVALGNDPSEQVTVLSAASDETLRTWVSTSYNEAAIISKPIVRLASPHDDAVWSARFSPDGRRVVSASRDQKARLMAIDPDTLAFREIAVLDDGETQVQSDELSEGSPFVGMSLAIDKHHGRLFIGSSDAVVRVWDLRRGVQLASVPGTGLNHSIAVSKSGELLLTGSSSTEHKAFLWSIDSSGRATIKHRLGTHQQAVTSLALSSDESLMFTGDRDGVAYIWSTATGQRLVGPIEVLRGDRINDAAFTPDGTRLLVASDKRQLFEIDVESGKPLQNQAHAGYVTHVSLSADGVMALTVSESLTRDRIESEATLWNLRNGSQRILESIDSPLQQKGRITSASFGNSNRLATISRSGSGASGSHSAKGPSVTLWQLDDRVDQSRVIQSSKIPDQLDAAQIAMPLSRQEIVTLNGESAFRWDLATTALNKSYRSHAAITQTGFSFDGRYVVTASRAIKIWDAATGKAVGKLESPHGGVVRSVQFSPVADASGDYLFVSGGDDGVVRTWLWSAKSQAFQPIHPYKTQNEQAVRSVCFSPSGQSLLATGSEGQVVVWNRHNTKVTFESSFGKNIAATCGQFSPSGNMIAIGGEDHFAKVWDLEHPESPITFRGHAAPISDVSFLGGGDQPLRLVTASEDKSARLWDLVVGKQHLLVVDATEIPQSGRELISLRRHTRGLTAVDVSHDDRLIMTAGRDGTLILWPAAEAPEIDLFERLQD